jgi:glutathione S-transferase
VAVHLGVTPELAVVDLAAGEQRTPAYLKLDPNGRVPVLVDGEFVLTESHAIMQYLAVSTPGQTLYPEARQARADVDRWLFWSAAHFQTSIRMLTWERVIKPMLGRGEPDPAEIERGDAATRQCVAVLDARLADRAWVTGATLTLADFALAAPLMYAAPARLPIEDAAHLRGWLERVQGLEAWRRTEVSRP